MASCPEIDPENFQGTLGKMNSHTFRGLCANLVRINGPEASGKTGPCFPLMSDLPLDQCCAERQMCHDFWSIVSEAGAAAVPVEACSMLIPVPRASAFFSALPTVPGNGRSTHPYSSQTEC